MGIASQPCCAYVPNYLKIVSPIHGQSINTSAVKILVEADPPKDTIFCLSLSWELGGSVECFPTIQTVYVSSLGEGNFA